MNNVRYPMGELESDRDRYSYQSVFSVSQLSRCERLRFNSLFIKDVGGCKKDLKSRFAAPVCITSLL